MDENVIATETKESRWKKFGPALFWGSMIAMPTMYVAGSYFGMREAQINREILLKIEELSSKK